MNKKEVDRSSCTNHKNSSKVRIFRILKEALTPSFEDKKAQVTIFIILGLVILFAFLFLIQISNTVQRIELADEQEQVFGKVFQKEALRIFVDGCLHDSLEEGLRLLGRQGTFWTDDEPPGRRLFQPGINGINYGEEKILYGIVNETSINYPCDDNDPLCVYRYPDNSVGFGERPILTINSLEGDLKTYLQTKAVECVEVWIGDEISTQATITSEEMDLEVEIAENTINVDVEYPLTFQLGNEEYFHLSEFDFSYETSFKQLIDAAILFPLQWDQRYLDFYYNENTLTNPLSYFEYLSPEDLSGCEDVEGEDYFSCKRTTFFEKYNSLGIEMTVDPLDNGDDLFTFTSDQIFLGEEFTFKIARQNRPPALDYVEQAACPGLYDYLVVPGAEDETLRSIDITLFAQDPDEDEGLDYSFTSETLGNREGDHLFVEIPQRGFHFPTATVEDEHGEKDSQEIVILVDRPLTATMSLSMPYQIRGSERYLDYDNIGFIDRYWVSKEDPVFVEVILPDYSIAPESIFNQATFDYQVSSESVEGFPISLASSYSIENNLFYYSFPYLGSPTGCIVGDEFCAINNYGEEQINLWFNNIFSFNPFQEITTDGELKLDFEINYCETTPQQTSTSFGVEVKACIPHQDPLYPYPYVPNDEQKHYQLRYVSDTETDLIRDETRNPFLADHACCAEDWNVKDAGEECFVNPEPGCYSELAQYTSLSTNDGYILETQKRVCDGNRGNICGEIASELYIEGEKALLCGHQEVNGCSRDIAEECQGEGAWDIAEDDEGNKGLCHGKMGCEDFSPGIILTIDNDQPLGFDNSFNLHQKAARSALTDLALAPSNNNDLPFGIGCTEGLRCDANLDFKFQGICSAGDCIE